MPAGKNPCPSGVLRLCIQVLESGKTGVAGSLGGVEEKLPYLRECGVNYLHLMPLLESPKGRSDGGYAVSDFRKLVMTICPFSSCVKLPGAVVGNTWGTVFSNSRGMSQLS